MKQLRLLLVAVTVFACGGDSTGPTEETQDFGTLEVTLTRAPDAPLLLFSASLRVGGGPPVVVEDGKTGVFPDLIPGAHSLEASDLTSSCTFQNPFPGSVTISANQVTQLNLVVTCDFNPESRFVFSWHQEGWSYDLFSVRPDGSDLQQLTQGGGSTVPSWSPDGTRVAYTARGEVWIMNFDGTEQRQLFPEFGENGGGPTWSPDGEKVAFHGGGSATAIMIGRVDGSGQVTTTQSGPESKLPSWSHDGSRIAYCNGSDGLTVMNASGTGQEVLTVGGPCYTPSWSPDDLTLAFTYAGPRGAGPFQIWQVGADGSDLQKLTDLPSFCDGSEYLPDGSKIVFHCRQGSLPEGLEQTWIMDPGGENQRPFTTVPWDGALRVRFWGLEGGQPN